MRPLRVTRPALLLTAAAALAGCAVLGNSHAGEPQPGTPRAHAPFLVVDEVIANDYEQQATRFELTFNKPPDFVTVDEFGRQANDFQYYIDNEALPPPVPEVPGTSLDILIRGGEIARTSKLVVRLSEGGNGDGGWGPIVDLVPFVLSGNKVEFAIPWAVLHETDGRFSYGLLLLEYGASSDHRSGTVPGQG